MLTRRRFIETAAAALPALATFGTPALAQEKTVDVAELMTPGPLPEMTLGNAQAKVTVVEYLSMTCSHCARFAATTFPVFKEKYVDSGKVFYVMRDFPLDPLAAAGFMLARNAPGGKFFEVVDYLFKTQADWAFVNDPVTALRDISKQFGYSPATFEATLSDQKLLDGINAVRQRGADVFGVDATPTFFINGVKHPGELTPDELAAIIDPQL
jgi:protein-disulfide isomerase